MNCKTEKIRNNRMNGKQGGLYEKKHICGL